MKFVLLSAHSSNSNWCEEALTEYQQKISYFFPLEIKKIKTKKINREDAEIKKNADSESLLKQIEPSDFVILLDEKGTVFDSVQFSKKLSQIIDQSHKKIIFVIGGPYGANESLKKRAQLKVSMSAMTMNHWVAQIVILEQVYRSMTILKCLPYHNS